MTCNACNAQIFARSDNSDERLRACIRAEKQEPVSVPEPEKKSVPAPEKIEKKSVPSWGFLGAN